MQVCSRCGTTWPVALGANGPVTARWCPYCNGDLYAPSPIRAAAPAAPPHTPPTAPPPAPQAAPQPARQQTPPHASQPAPAPAPHAGPGTAPASPPVPGSQAAPPAAPQTPAPSTPPPQTPAPSAPAPRGAAPRLQAPRLPRGYRWWARSPEHPADPPPVGPPPPAGPTPRYTETPRWGLPISPRPATEPGVGARTARWAACAPDLLRVRTAGLVPVIAAEGCRYLLLLIHRGRAL